MKLSKAQQEVVDNMREQWDIHYNTVFGTCWMRNILCGSSKRIHPKVFASLEEKKVIERRGFMYPIRTYRLTEQYKTATVGQQETK